MTDYLPDVYEDFRARYPDVDERLGRLAAAVRDTGPLDERSYRRAKLGIAIGARAEGAVRSSVRKGLQLGIAPAELRQVALMAITTCGFPAAIAALGWVDEVLAEET